MTGSIRIRPATADDCRAIWLWRNDPQTRAMSRTPDEIVWRPELPHTATGKLLRRELRAQLVAT